MNKIETWNMVWDMMQFIEEKAGHIFKYYEMQEMQLYRYSTVLTKSIAIKCSLECLQLDSCIFIFLKIYI